VTIATPALDRTDGISPRPTVVTPQSQRSQVAMAQALKHHQAGQLADAVAAYDEALAAMPDKVAALVNKGVALRRLGRLSEAMACYWRVLAVEPGNLECWCNAGNALLDMGRTEEARAVLEYALRKGPLIAEAWLAMSNVLVRQKHEEAAEVALRRAVTLAPENVAARLQLAGLLEPRKPADALALYETLRKQVPADPSAFSGTAQALISLGRLDEAEPLLRTALELDTNHLDARLGMARLLLLKGDLTNGWPAYEWRRQKAEGRYPKLPGPEWDGSDPAGKTILVYAEQGFGDTIQFACLLPLLSKRGATVRVICQKPLLNLMQRINGVASAQAVWKPLPAYDFWCPLLSLPGPMGLTKANIPANAPYLPSVTLSQRLAAPVGTRLKVGLSWAGSPTHGHDRDRSAGLETLLPLTGVAGAAFYSLQAGPRASDLDKVAHPALIGAPSRGLSDFAETAALIHELDLVITVDSAVAHLAGAMGKPVWVLIPFSPDWRWQRDREDSPWYPSMRLFRQTEAGDWIPVVERMTAELAALAGSRPLPAAESAEVLAESIFPNADGKPRFHMTSPRHFLPDPGIKYLVQRERAGIGYEYATRSFLDAHLRPGDLFIDVGAHWGIMALQAATRWPGQIDVLAVEPSPRNLPQLRRWIAVNGLGEKIEVVGVAAADKAGKGELKPESTMGHSLIKSKSGSIPVVTIDGLLAARPQLEDRRVIVKIDVEGSEAEVVKGMADLLASRRVAAVIWERGIEYENPEGQKRLKKLRAHFDKLGFTAWRFESEDAAGPLAPFVESGLRGNIIELAAGIMPEAAYGHPRPAAVQQLADPVTDASLVARNLFQTTHGAHKTGKIKQALDTYARAAALDASIPELWNNLGVTLRNMGRLAASEACYARAQALNPEDAGVMSNRANVLRELGKLAAAEALQTKALEIKPGDAGLIYNAGVLQRDKGEPKNALILFERALAFDPDNEDLKWDRALALLQAGDYGKGFPAYEARWGLTRAKHKKMPMKLWDGSPLGGRNIFLTDEQGFGDVLQFARFIPEVKRRGAGKVVLECQPELMRLLAATPGVDAVLPRERAVPACDVYTPVLSLPGIFGVTLETLPKQVPYLVAPEPSHLLPDDQRTKVGLVWAGKPKPRDRSCPLEKLLPLFADPRIAPYSLQVGPRAADLKALGADAFVTDLEPVLCDFAETAAVLKQLDLLITIDTAIAHLAGALGVPTFLLLRYTSDWRWFDKGLTSPWYPSFRLFRQRAPNDWNGALDEIKAAMGDLTKEQQK